MPRPSSVSPIPRRRPRRVGRSICTSRIAATGGIRAACHAGEIADRTVMTMPDDQTRRRSRCDGTTMLVPGRSIPIALIAALSPIASSDTGDDPDDRRDEADEHRLPEDLAHHLPAARTDRAQQRHLPRALRDDDRERVVDDERPDDQRDEREHAEEDVDELQLVAQRVLVLLGDRLTGDHLVLALVVGVQCLRDVAAQLLLRHARIRDRPKSRENCPLALAIRCASGRLNNVADAPARLSASPNFAMPTRS